MAKALLLAAVASLVIAHFTSEELNRYFVNGGRKPFRNTYLHYKYPITRETSDKVFFQYRGREASFEKSRMNAHLHRGKPVCRNHAKHSQFIFEETTHPAYWAHFGLFFLISVVFVRMAPTLLGAIALSSDRRLLKGGSSVTSLQLSGGGKMEKKEGKRQEMVVRSAEVLPPERVVRRERPPGVSDILDSEVVPIPFVENYKKKVIDARRGVVEAARKYTEEEIAYLRTRAKREAVGDEIEIDHNQRTARRIDTARKVQEAQLRSNRVSRKGVQQDLKDDVRELTLERKKKGLQDQTDSKLETLRKENERLKLELENAKLKGQGLQQGGTTPRGLSAEEKRQARRRKFERRIQEREGRKQGALNSILRGRSFNQLSRKEQAFYRRTENDYDDAQERDREQLKKYL